MTHYIALGANLPGPQGEAPRAMCERALRWMAEIPGICVQARSPWYSSAPVPAGNQPRFINGVARLAGDISPAGLLAALQACEARAGRLRGAANAARPLDLDIIDMGGMVRDAPDPVLPHPRAHLRAFVLRPLRDVAPGWVHPRLGVTVSALLEGVAEQDVR
jgi:2-amino-4-hydroxy-6-hydroxymethyldihydropteridine diphosphokinase